MNELIKKAENIKLIAFDVDGVLTDGSITYTAEGVELKTFNAKDGQGMAMLSREGFVTAIITARQSKIVEKRSKELGITHLYQGAKNKIIAMKELMNQYKLDFSQIAYVGDDLPDICILKNVALACCPADAVDEVKQTCNFISKKDGGRGAVREVSDILLKAKHQKTSNETSGEVNLPAFNK